ncbi:MAG: DGQHR domain-containing protein [Bacteroidetes bacterium]|nr:DGQHR domain-containing protein [Bacteroidota bacterium]
MKFPAIKYSQTNYSLISTVLPFEIVNRKSKTLIYGIDEGGYQRIQDEKHYLNIKKYVETGNFVFPNSIVLAIDESQLSKIESAQDQGITFLNFDDTQDVLFRVVDGQHRLLGIEKASQLNSKLLNLNLQISIIITPNNKRSVEMEIFSNLNSKAKRLKTDLIELARYDFRILEDKIGSRDLNSHISINTAFNLNENTSVDNVWQNAIKIDIHSENRIGIIGVTAFSESISGIVASYISLKQNEVEQLDDSELIAFSRSASKDISQFLINCWKIVNDKWPKTFLDPHKMLDIDNQYKSIIYDPNFYIQKTLGCKSIGYLISDILKDQFDNTFNIGAIESFRTIIYDSKLNDFDWKLGKTLSGISSESGFKKVTKIIKNEEPFIRKE